MFIKYVYYLQRKQFKLILIYLHFTTTSCAAASELIIHQLLVKCNYNTPVFSKMNYNTPASVNKLNDKIQSLHIYQ